MKTMLFCLCVPLLLLGCATPSEPAFDPSRNPNTAVMMMGGGSQSTGPEDSTTREANDKLFPSPGPVENQDAIVQWVPQKALETADNSPAGLIRIKKFDCTDPDLVPTHPQQTTKLYHRYLVGHYDQFKLVKTDSACKIGSSGFNGRHQYSCLLADDAEDAIISDLYEDRCGHIYRGFFHVSFMKKSETMASLFALGRTLYEDHKAGYPGAYVVGQTYEVEQKQFLFLAEPFKLDADKIALNQEQAKASHSRDAKTLLYNPIKPTR